MPGEGIAGIGAYEFSKEITRVIVSKPRFMKRDDNALLWS